MLHSRCQRAEWYQTTVRTARPRAYFSGHENLTDWPAAQQIKRAHTKRSLDCVYSALARASELELRGAARDAGADSNEERGAGEREGVAGEHRDVGGRADADGADARRQAEDGRDA